MNTRLIMPLGIPMALGLALGMVLALSGGPAKTQLAHSAARAVATARASQDAGPAPQCQPELRDCRATVPADRGGPGHLVAADR
jgi:hypothetical protein